jgi:hypothetical protein
MSGTSGEQSPQGFVGVGASLNVAVSGSLVLYRLAGLASSAAAVAHATIIARAARRGGGQDAEGRSLSTRLAGHRRALLLARQLCEE